MKLKFTDITQKQIAQFKTDLEDFAERFHGAGPGAVGGDLDHGLKILTDFKKELAKSEAERSATLLGAISTIFHLISFFKCNSLKQRPITFVSAMWFFRQELTNAEKLFDLPITTYPNLLRVQTEMRGLEMVYALYEEQKNAREEWAQTLWANLNVNLVSKYQLETAVNIAI